MSHPEAAGNSDLSRSREEITNLTLAIARLTGARNLVAARIGNIKRGQDTGITDPGRESDLLQRLLEEPVPGLTPDAKFKLVGTLIHLATEVQETYGDPSELLAATAPAVSEASALPAAPAQAEVPFPATV